MKNITLPADSRLSYDIRAIKLRELGSVGSDNKNNGNWNSLKRNNGSFNSMQPVAKGIVERRIRRQSAATTTVITGITVLSALFIN